VATMAFVGIPLRQFLDAPAAHSPPLEGWVGTARGAPGSSRGVWPR
jgi:hypothetical protein